MLGRHHSRIPKASHKGISKFLGHTLWLPQLVYIVTFSHRRLSHIRPRNLTWNLKITVSKWTFLFQGLIFRFHVKFRGCIVFSPKLSKFLLGDISQKAWIQHPIFDEQVVQGGAGAASALIVADPPGEVMDRCIWEKW